MQSANGRILNQGQLGSVSPSESQQQTGGNNQIYGTSRQSEQPHAGSQGTFSPYRSGSVPVGFYALQRENVFPERPGQPECQFYMKTGDCKFGAVCRFHHPRERLIPTPDCVLSPIGLPLRPVSCLFAVQFCLPFWLWTSGIVVFGKCLYCFSGFASEDCTLLTQLLKGFAFLIISALYLCSSNPSSSAEIEHQLWVNMTL